MLRRLAALAAATCLLGFPASPTLAGPNPVSLGWIPGSSVKLEQVNGDCDWQHFDYALGTGTCQRTTSQTASRFNILGDGFGYSWEDNGKLLFIFGDTISTNPSVVNYHAHDPIAWSTSTDPGSGLLLNFFTNPDNSPLFIEPSGVAMGADDIANSGITLPDGVYLVVNTGADESLADPHQNAYSILVRFDETAKTFTPGRTISRLPGGHFVFTALHAMGSDVYMFGAGNYRASDIFLSKTPATGFWSGTGTHRTRVRAHLRPVAGQARRCGDRDREVLRRQQRHALVHGEWSELHEGDHAPSVLALHEPQHELVRRHAPR